MDITILKNPSLITVADISIGECFLYKGDQLWFKTADILKSDTNFCINLLNGFTYNFPQNEKVSKCNSNITVIV